MNYHKHAPPAPIAGPSSSKSSSKSSTKSKGKERVDMSSEIGIYKSWYNQAIEDIAIKEAPTAVRARKTSKPRAKKSQQSEKAIIPMEIEQTSKLPKGKEIKKFP